MTDREILVDMLTRAGVNYREQDNALVVERKEGDYAAEPKLPEGVWPHGDQREKGPNRGYIGFFTVFSFNEDGSLEAVGAWE